MIVIYYQNYRMKSVYESNLFKTLLAISHRSKSESVNEVIINGLIQIQIFSISIILVVGLIIAKYLGSIEDLLHLFSINLVFVIIFLIISFMIGNYFLSRYFFKNFQEIENIQYPNDEYVSEIKSTSTLFDTLMIVIVIILMILLLF